MILLNTVWLSGAACGVVGLIIVAITVGLAFTKYSKQKRNEASRIWESL
jgi:hypothetical protein